MFSSQRLSTIAGQACHIARMTREDAEQLAAVFLQIASRQVRDARASVAKRLR